jgi:hypothetical protein
VAGWFRKLNSDIAEKFLNMRINTQPKLKLVMAYNDIKIKFIPELP